MTTIQGLSEAIICKVNDGVSLANVSPASEDPAVKKFLEILSLTRSAPGHINQFYGHMVEQPEYFFLVYNWESPEHHAAYLRSEDHDTILARIKEVFNIKEFPPFIMYFPFNPDATAAIKSPVTEVAFFTLPTANLEEAKKVVDGGLNGADGPNVMELVVSVGKATGAATGWVSSSKPPGSIPEGRSVALYGFFGYKTIDDHMEWRKAPEHAAVVAYQSKLFQPLDMDTTVVKGLDLSMFHVHFEEAK